MRAEKIPVAAHSGFQMEIFLEDTVEKALVEQIPKVMPIAGFIKLTQLRGCPY
jgi:hypothetical protein